MMDRKTFEGHLRTIAANKQSYDSGFRPGQKTLASRQFDEDIRQFDTTFKEDQFRDRRDFTEGQRQFDATLANKFALEAMSGGGGGSGSSEKDMYSQQAFIQNMDENAYLSDLEAIYQKFANEQKAAQLSDSNVKVRPMGATLDYLYENQGRNWETIAPERQKELAFQFWAQKSQNSPNKAAAEALLGKPIFSSFDYEKGGVASYGKKPPGGATGTTSTGTTSTNKKNRAGETVPMKSVYEMYHS